MSYDLQWLLVRSNSSFIVKNKAPGVILSREPGNLLNIHSQRLSPLSNAKSVAVNNTDAGIEILARDATKQPRGCAAANKSTILKKSTTGRKAAEIAAKAASKTRPDLRSAAVARATTYVKIAKAPKDAKPKRSTKVQA